MLSPGSSLRCYCREFRIRNCKKAGIRLRSCSSFQSPYNLRLLQGFGESGPYARYGSNASVNNAMAGWTFSAWKDSGRPGTKALGIGDEAGGISLALGIVAALFARERIKEGQMVEVSMQEALLGFMVSSLHTHF